MILYFSGTGNSRYIAEVINSVIEDKLVSINECLKNNLIESPIMNKEKTLETIELVNQLYKKWQ